MLMTFFFFKVKSTTDIFKPLFKNANSFNLFSNIEKLNLIDEKISFEGIKLISVPFL